ncbi:hypothetical protein N7509_005862 [Penicillium cosmopolitanum]|uniref:Uncharacterized protein n=1 Tax=Penicillium cosmopolitanum TaxID=1131564 RepID=A0A9W9W311_9EURO|nr:uncharacterized protein N7509_005862 [Penicillium cosmopolitanum]KAJ5397749.1 hypothetical protein N7509_005862 [Penicillium cosmopolitanum]
MRRMIELPWVFDSTPSPSIIYDIFDRLYHPDSLIFIDEQSRQDDTAIVLLYEPELKAVRVPINGANLLLSAVTGGKATLEGSPVADSHDSEVCCLSKCQGSFLTTKLTKAQETEVIQNQEEPYSSNKDYIVIILESMTEEELEKIKTELFLNSKDFHWINVSSKLESPDMEGLLAYFETKRQKSPKFFIAVDRKTLEVANTPVDKRYQAPEVIIASHEGTRFWISDDIDRSHALVHAGYGYQRTTADYAVLAYVNLMVSNMGFYDLCEEHEAVYWKACKSWAEENMESVFRGERRLASAWYPARGGGGRIDYDG